VKYYTYVAYLNISLLRFFAISLAIHLILLLWSAQLPHRPILQPPIPVSLIPPPQVSRSESSPSPESSRPPTDVQRRTAKVPTRIAKKAAPPVAEKTAIPKEIPPAKEPKREEPKREEPRLAAREQIPNQAIVAERPLPTLKELLPPVGWSTEARSRGTEGPIRLDTNNPQYVTYFNSIKRAIEVVWQYPELALRYGLQGRLLLEFSILGNGELERAKIVRSSGSNLLDEEALRAVKTAAPFGPIPPWIGRNRVDIIASFEYVDNRLNYRFLPGAQ
jgi:periplasmic protein TonB